VLAAAFQSSARGKGGASRLAAGPLPAPVRPWGVRTCAAIRVLHAPSLHRQAPIRLLPLLRAAGHPAVLFSGRPHGPMESPFSPVNGILRQVALR